MFKNFTLNRLLVLTATAGFAFLLLDTLLEHWATFKQETLTFIPPIFSFIGLIIGILAVYKWNAIYIRVMHIYLILSIAVALGGFYLHLEPEEDLENLTYRETIHESTEKEKPLLAPFSFGGVAVIGLLGTLRKWNAEVI